MQQQVKPIRSADSTVAPITASAAEIAAATYYDDIFVPALFASWVAPLAQAAGIEAGERVLDVACGSGIVARELESGLAPGVRLVGLDLAPGMIAVAGARANWAEWRLGDACALPFADASFDRVICQFGLMFFADRVAALAEMRRVLRPGGRFALSAWDSLGCNPGFAAKVAILDRMAGRAAGDALRAPFCLGDGTALRELLERSGARDCRIETRAGEARFASLQQFVDAELRGWLPVMGVHLDDDTIDAIFRECERELGAYKSSREFTMPVSAHLVAGGK